MMMNHSSWNFGKSIIAFSTRLHFFGLIGPIASSAKMRENLADKHFSYIWTKDTKFTVQPVSSVLTTAR